VSLSDLKRLLFGQPLSNREVEHEKLPVWKGLSVFSSDALSSVAYATEEILIILVALSVAASVWSIPIALTIAALLIIVSLSYRQTISLYPNGGGAYTVAKENLGETAGLLAGAALLIDYILTVAVSISAGVAAIVSAFPSLAEQKVHLAILLVFLMTFLNLRGLRESSFIFSIPTYFFVACLFLLLGVGFFRSLSGEIPPKTDLIHEAYPAISIFFILRAFASGCAALTGIEAISNGVPAFKNPAVHNAKKTLTIMVCILAVSFIGVTALGHMHMIVPKHGETMLSQIARLSFGQGFFYYAMQAATAAILVLAANTAYADFPRLTSILGKDRFLPRQLSNIGDRLVFSNGILSLGFAAICLIYLFDADTHSLIPLYSVGVFLSFTLSQAGMIVHHLRYKEKHWGKGLTLNAMGALVTFLVLMVVATTKFTEGAWIIILLAPSMLYVFRAINRHYVLVGRQLRLLDVWKFSETKESLVLVPISGFHTGVIKALEYAQDISHDVHLCVVDVDHNSTSNIRSVWDAHFKDRKEFHLEVLESPYRSVITPFVDYVQRLKTEFPDRTISVVIPEFVTKKWWHNFLHNQTAFFLKARLRWVKRVVVISVYYQLKV
jgi:amino acid transporter